jgi:hypothetical protein
MSLPAILYRASAPAAQPPRFDASAAAGPAGVT